MLKTLIISVTAGVLFSIIGILMQEHGVTNYWVYASLFYVFGVMFGIII